jgi:MHS family metabolite:H+ symporter-like MFS transporter
VTTVAGVSHSVGPLAVACASLAGIVTIPLFGMLSDRIGRVPLYRMAALFQAIFAVPAFALMSSGNTVLICVVITIGIGVGVNGMLGSQCALLAELFGARHRYTGVAGVQRRLVAAGGLRRRPLADHLRHHLLHPGDPGPGPHRSRRRPLSAPRDVRSHGSPHP